ncbi:MAG: thioredoxin family protein [Desulfohalobiaceae bacterium]
MTSKTKKYLAAFAAMLTLLTFLVLGQSESLFESSSPQKTTNQEQEMPVPGKVTMLDLGADDCKPCKMMAPILEELKKAYAERAAIVFIDVRKNREAAKEYDIQTIPTQIFFNANGEEVQRHTGFMDKETIIKKLADLGVEPPEEYQDL